MSAGLVPSGGSEGESVPESSLVTASNPWHSSTYRGITPVSVSIFTWLLFWVLHGLPSVHVAVSKLPSACKDQPLD